MEELKQKIRDMESIAVNSNPVLYDMICELLDFVENNTFYTHHEVLEMFNRKDGIEIEHD
jgi:hypothetical protein